VSCDPRDTEFAALAATAIRGMVLAGSALELAAQVQQLLAAVLEYRAGLAGEQPEHAALLRAIQRRPT
jgi:hypothetical protein